MTPPKRVKEVHDRHLQCRMLGHRWRYHDAWKEGRGFKQTLICQGCKTVRTDIIDSGGNVVKKTYAYVDEYLLQGAGTGGYRLTHHDRGKLRLRLIQKHLS